MNTQNNVNYVIKYADDGIQINYTISPQAANNENYIKALLENMNNFRKNH